MRLLVVNWQDRTNPKSGGAEVHLHELFGRLVSRGHEVTLLCSGYDGAAPRDTLDGITVHRVGGRHTFALAARRYYAQHLAPQPFDVLVEDLNKIPLWTPSWGRTPVVCLVHHLFGTTAFREASWPVAWLTTVAEDTLPRRYRGVPFQAVSESTKADLVHRGIPARDIEVIVQGIRAEWFTPDPAARSPEPVIAYVGRLKRYKEVELILRAFAAMGHPTARLEIAGAGDHKPALEALAASLALGQRVRFLGFISEEAKRDLLRRAWVVALTSSKEGWGITNIEAAACGTPVVASDAPGLRESVKDGDTGFLVPHGDVAALRAAFERIVADPARVALLGTRGRRFAEELTWDRAADHTMSHLNRVVRRGGE